MLDSLLGRASLKAEIETLEAELADCRDELDRLEEQREAADRRRREAIREGQAAQEERNRLEDRIEQLTTDLERARGGTSVSPRGRRRCSRTHTDRILQILSSVETEPEGAYTAMVTDAGADAIREHFSDRRGLVADAAPCLCLFDDAGLIEVALEPPLAPAPFERWDDRFHLETEWFLPTGSFSFALVRADRFALGTYDGSTMTYRDGFESEVMGRHSKGGFSQARFERRREEQIDAHLDRVTEAMAQLDPDELVLAGSREALDRLEIDARASVAVDASGPLESALESAFDAVWTTTLHRL